MRLKVKVKGDRAIIYYKDGNVIRVVEPKVVYENVFKSNEKESEGVQWIKR